jgi:hypothetical protein
LSSFYSIASKQNGLNISDSANIGTFIGGVIGTIWTLVSVFLFYLNLQKQTEAIDIQQKQLNITKKQIDNQQFESTFFNLLRTQQEIRNQIKYKTIDKQTNQTYLIESSSFFEFVGVILRKTYSKQVDNISEGKVDIEISDFNTLQLDQEQLRDGLNLLIDNLKNKDKYKNLTEPIDKAKLAYSITFDKFHNQIGHYFRHLYHILKFILDNQIREIELIKEPNDDKIDNVKKKYRGYVNFIQAQMTSSELLILFYNGLCFKEIKKLIHTFDFLENLAKEDLIEPSHCDFYKETEIDGEKYPSVTLKSRENIGK